MTVYLEGGAIYLMKALKKYSTKYEKKKPRTKT